MPGSRRGLWYVMAALSTVIALYALTVLVLPGFGSSPTGSSSPQPPEG